MIIGLGITKIKFVTDLPALSISPSIYANETSFLINQLVQGDTNLTSNILGNFPIPPYNPSSIVSSDISAFDSTVYAKRNSSQLYAYYLDSLSPSTAAYTVFFNTTAPFAPYIAVNAMNNAILKLLSRNPNASIKMNLNPLLPTKGVKSIEDTIDGFIVVMLLALGFSFIPSSMILFIIKERENNAKHQQIISGVNVVAYWLSNFIVDYLKYLIPAIATYILFFIFDVTFFITGDKAGVSILLFVLYGIAMVGYTYLASFMFRKPSSGQVFIFLLCFFTSFVLVIVMFSLKLISDTREVTVNVLDYIFRLIPSFSFPYGFLMMANASLFIRVFRWPSNTGSFSGYIAGNDLIYIICIGLFTYVVIFVIEYWFVIMGLKKKSKAPSSLINKINENENKKETDIDPDVLEEQKSVLSNLKNFSVKVSNLWKIYRVKSSSSSDGTSINYKAAVKGISFGVEQGMVFSLLGTNGAGKTSTFKVLTGDISASFGEATIMGYEMPQNLIQIRHLVGYCPQFDSILENLTAQEHLELYANLKGIKPEYHEVLIERMLETMNLTTYRNVKAGTYSGGNKRKLNVAIALLGRPPIVFLDEPSSGMDPEARRFMWSVINEISTKRKHSSVILTTHSMEESEALSTKIAIMVEGRIKTIGSVQQLKNKYGKGFELDIKMMIPSEEEVEQAKRRIMTRVPINNYDAIVAQEIRQILQAENLMYLDKEIAAGKKGSAIFKRLELNRSFEGGLLVEWMLISQKLQKVQEHVIQRFDAVLLETFQTYIRFKIPESNKLSEVFEYMDECKGQLEIATYSVRQISLEQIFIQFAQDIQHDD
jgi:ATP-binding cassette subfamily A (ABC1) protein 3